jgi:hypothetical protein
MSEPNPNREDTADRAIDPAHAIVLGLCALALLAITWHYLAA